MTRRSFVSLAAAGVAGIVALGVGGLAALVRMLVPGVYYEPPQKFKAGFPNDFPPGSATFLPHENVFVFRDQVKGFSAASAVCPHLGCTVRYVAAAREFRCPCHASVFAADGRVLSGPAPRPIEWLEITLAKDGQLQVDKSRTVAESYHLRAT